MELFGSGKKMVAPAPLRLRPFSSSAQLRSGVGAAHLWPTDRLVILCLGTCHTTVKQSFLCLCVNGWRGDRCESQVNLCREVQCLNGGVCRPSFLSYTCECLGESFSGRHCEITSRETILRQRLSKSFAYIAIIAMISVAVLVVTMDVLKYAFGIDPVKEELDKQQQMKKVKEKRTVMVIRYLYVHSSTA